MVEYNRIYRLSKFLILFFLFLYTFPIFYYSEKVSYDILIFLIINYCITIFFFLFIKFGKCKFDINIISLGNNRFVTYVFLILILYFLIWFETKEYFIAPFNRSTRNSDFIVGNFYVVVDILIKALFCLIIYSEFLKSDSERWKRYAVFLLIIFAVLFDIVYLGARRTSIFIIMSSMWAYLPVLKKKKYYLLIFFLIFVGILNFLLSGYRELIFAGYNSVNFNQILAASIFTNEYQLVSTNFLHYVNYTSFNGYGLGSSIIIFPLTFIPRFIWINKPLTIDKITGIFPNLIGELYYNFGFFSFIFLLLYFSFLFYLLRRNNIYSMIIFSLIPELFRTTVSTFLFTLSLFAIILKILSIRIKPMH